MRKFRFRKKMFLFQPAHYISDRALINLEAPFSSCSVAVVHDDCHPFSVWQDELVLIVVKVTGRGAGIDLGLLRALGLLLG